MQCSERVGIVLGAASPPGAFNFYFQQDTLTQSFMIKDDLLQAFQHNQKPLKNQENEI